MIAMDKIDLSDGWRVRECDSRNAIDQCAEQIQQYLDGKVAGEQVPYPCRCFRIEDLLPRCLPAPCLRSGRASSPSYYAESVLMSKNVPDHTYPPTKTVSQPPANIVKTTPVKLTPLTGNAQEDKL
jgi:hypothetical protein